jgi:hypothetical protein
MPSITDTYATLTEVLLSDYQGKKGPAHKIFSTRLLKPLLPAAVRIGTGQLLDIKDRMLGPFDIVGCWEAFPPLGEGMASQFIVDGVLFCLQVRDWKEEDLTQFAAMAGQAKMLARKTAMPLICAAVGFESLPVAQVAEFLKSATGKPIDAVLSIGQHFTVRNEQGWYGDSQRIPMVTEKGEGESLKGFAFWMTHLVQTFLGMPYHLGDYQHL